MRTDRWLQPFLAGLLHPPGRVMFPHYVAWLIGLGILGSVSQCRLGPIGFPAVDCTTSSRRSLRRGSTGGGPADVNRSTGWRFGYNPRCRRHCLPEERGSLGRRGGAIRHKAEQVAQLSDSNVAHAGARRSPVVVGLPCTILQIAIAKIGRGRQASLRPGCVLAA